ncbi:hypothetical protein FDV58_10065 [Bradyrhizobium elkanii]|uniref:Uncharacterized protein n=2 Tax=Bradyrhizobium TaxID=374 RepID=A0A4U6SB52_BRAEL|nr:hypothetical protein [Bradyrhizobium elkanii]TKV81976.1 hypothetical protein FDV58_10065 [Bradyrhizobium elkanii]
MMGNFARSALIRAGAQSVRQQQGARYDISCAKQVRDRSKRPLKVIRVPLASIIGEQPILSEKVGTSESKPNSFSARPGKRYSFVDAKRDDCCHAGENSVAKTRLLKLMASGFDSKIESRPTSVSLDRHFISS